MSYVERSKKEAKGSYVYASKMKALYTQLITEQSQKLCPFGQNEQRFRWLNSTLQNHISTGEDINNFKIKRFKKNDNLDGGIGRFYQMNERFKHQTIQAKRTNYNSLDKKNASLTLNSQRVIHPSLNNEVERKTSTQKRICLSSQRFKHSTDGSITSLLQKTPMTVEVRGKKRYNQSFDSHLFSSIDNDRCQLQPAPKKGIRLFLNRTPFLSLDTPKTSGRKHFLSKLDKKVFSY